MASDRSGSFKSSPTEPRLPTGSSLKKRKLSCLLCQQKKIKCDKKEPCSQCIKFRVECVSPVTSRVRKKRFPEAELLARIRRYEEALRKYGIDVEALNSASVTSGLDPTTPASLASPVDIPQNSTSRKRLTSLNKINCISSTTPRTKNEFQYTEELLQGSSDESNTEAEKGPILRTWDSIHDDSTLLFMSEPVVSNLTTFHPEPVQIYRLWQTFLDNFNPLIKVVHTPTLQLQILNATANLDAISTSLEALMFSIYTTAIFSLEDAECRKMFGESRDGLLSKYQFAAVQALLKASVLKSSDLTVLQALIMYVQTIRKHVDPRSLFNLLGICVRNAQRIGLHRDGATQGRSIFETEMRRRLWWQIILYDTRIAEICGAGSAITTSKWNTRFPLNVNDSDLYPEMKELPVEHVGATEMVFVLIRCEVAAFLGTLRAETVFDGSWHELSNMSLPLASKETAISRLEERLKERYVVYCDQQIPLHVMAKATAESSTCKLRLIAYHPRLLPDKGASMTERTRDLLMTWAIKMSNCFNSLISRPSLERFAWFTYANIPIDANIFLFSELRQRPGSEFADQAWDSLSTSHDNWELERSCLIQGKADSSLGTAISALAIKAWEARTDSTDPPDFIERAKARFAQKQSSSKATDTATGTLDLSTPSSDISLQAATQNQRRTGYPTHTSSANNSYPFTNTNPPSGTGTDIDGTSFGMTDFVLSFGAAEDGVENWPYWTGLIPQYEPPTDFVPGI